MRTSPLQDRLRAERLLANLELRHREDPEDGRVLAALLRVLIRARRWERVRDLAAARIEVGLRPWDPARARELCALHNLALDALLASR